MAFINNNKLKEIKMAAAQGNEKAQAILQSLMSNKDQESIDKMTNDYYQIPTSDPIAPETIITTEESQVREEMPAVPIQEGVDLTELLDKELDGIISMEEIKELSFGDFLQNKRSNFNKGRKNADYFKGFDSEGRAKYLGDKVNSYKGSFNSKLKDIDRSHRDLTNSLSIYSQEVGNMFDDGRGMDMNVANQVYDSMVDNHDMMLGLARGHDEEDRTSVIEALNELVREYGKENVMVAMNILKNDNDNYKDYKNNQIHSEVERYAKSIEKLLK